MARFKPEEVEHYGGQGGAGFFSLKNDKDVAQARFMYDTIEDVEGYAVHEVEIDGRKRYVNCLRAYNEPLDNCPFCKAQRRQLVKLFVPLYNLDKDQVQIWERGKKYFQTLSSLCSRYPNLASHVFEIERSGKPGDTQTSYREYEVKKDNTTLEDLPEVPTILGGVVLDKTPEEMEYYLDNNVFPSSDNLDERPRRRDTNSEEQITRRTPANRRDTF